MQGRQAVQCRLGRNGWTQPAVSHAYGSGEHARPHGESDLAKTQQHRNLRGVRSHSVNTILLMRASATGRRHSSVSSIHMVICYYFRMVQRQCLHANNQSPWPVSAVHHSKDHRLHARPYSFTVTSPGNCCWSAPSACSAASIDCYGRSAPRVDHCR